MILQVTANKLNQRKSPASDFFDKSNVQDVVTKGFTFESIGVLSNLLGKWYIGSDGFYYWSGGVKPALVPANNVIPERVTPVEESKMSWGLKRLLISEFWKAANNKGDRIRVAILDTGISLEHPEFDYEKIDQRNILQENTDVNDSNGHGSHIAGIICARGERITGVAPNTEISVIKISETPDFWQVKNVVAGIDQAISDKADIISISGQFNKGTTDLDLLKRKVEETTERGITIVASAGNNFNEFPVESFPAAFDECISVGSIQEDGTRADSSSHSTKLDVVAPGDKIFSTWTGTSYKTESGTSMATPFVAGVIAVLKSYARLNLQKELTPSEIQVILNKSADDAGDTGFDTSYGFGIVNPLKALQMLTK